MTTQIRDTKSRAFHALRDNLKTLADKNQWTQAQLGAHIGLNQKAVGRILNLDNEPTLATLSGIADKLKKPDALLLCPGMSADVLLIKSTISEPLRALIDQLVALDSAGNLSDQLLGALNAMIWAAMEAHSVTQKSDKTRRAGAY